MFTDAISMQGCQQGGGKNYILNSTSYMIIIYGYMNVDLLTTFHLQINQGEQGVGVFYENSEAEIDLKKYEFQTYISSGRQMI